MSMDFNEKSTTAAQKAAKSSENVFEEQIKSGERTRFVHKPNPLVERSYQIFEYNFKKGEYEPVGDYVLINKDEKPDVTDKKVINLMSLLNGKKDELIDISNLTTTRLLYSIVPEAQSGEQTKIILKDYDGSGVSKENAVFTIRKGVFDE